MNSPATMDDTDNLHEAITSLGDVRIYLARCQRAGLVLPEYVDEMLQGVATALEEVQDLAVEVVASRQEGR